MFFEFMILKNSMTNDINETKELSSFLEETKNQYISFLMNDYDRQNSKIRNSHIGCMQRYTPKEKENGRDLFGILKVNSISRFLSKQNHNFRRQKDSISIFDNARLSDTLKKPQKQSAKRPCSAFTTIIKRPVNNLQEKVQGKSLLESRQEMSLLGKSCVKVCLKDQQVLQCNIHVSLPKEAKNCHLKKRKMHASKSSHCLNKFKIESDSISKQHKQHNFNACNQTFIQNRQKLVSEMSAYKSKNEGIKYQKQPKKLNTSKKVCKKQIKHANQKKIDNQPPIFKKQLKKSENIHNWNSLYQNGTGKKKIFSTQLRKSIKKSQKKIDQMKMMNQKTCQNPLIIIENIDNERNQIDEFFYSNIVSNQHFQRCKGAYEKISPLLKQKLKMSCQPAMDQHLIVKKGRY